MTKEELLALAEKITDGTATDAEIALYNQVLSQGRQPVEGWNETLLGNRAELEAGIRTAIMERTGLRKVRRMAWTRWAAAAVLLLTAAVGGYFYLHTKPAETAPPVAAAPASRFRNDVDPGQQGAILTLANGATIVLDSAANGALATQGNAQVIKRDGELVYNVKGAGTPVLNTMTTPKGRQYHLTLADGTRVWLNAASSITYPTAFTGNSRQVQVSGEVYFEVAHQDGMPFEVRKDEVRVTVLGTHFNMNTYNDEAALKVTLLEGSVRVAGSGGVQTIKPGQQAQVTGSGLSVHNNVDVEAVMAWKNGLFHFKGADVGSLMRQLARWYDVEVVYQQRVNDLFYAEIPQQTKLSDVLRALELTGKVHFGIEGKKIIVMP